MNTAGQLSLLGENPATESITPPPVRYKYTPATRRLEEFTWHMDTATGTSHALIGPNSPACNGASLRGRFVPETNHPKTHRCVSCRISLTKRRFPDDRWAHENWWYNWVGHTCHVLENDLPICHAGTKHAQWTETSLVVPQARRSHYLRRLIKASSP